MRAILYIVPVCFGAIIQGADTKMAKDYTDNLQEMYRFRLEKIV